jgi:hypothetical protein
MLLVGSDRARSCERDFQNWARGHTGGAAYWFSIWIFITLLERHASEVREYLAALKARPIVAERVDLKRLPPDWQALRPYSAVPVPRRIGNGRR